MGSRGLFCSWGLKDGSEGCARGDLQPLPALQRLRFVSCTYRQLSLPFLSKFFLKELLFFLPQAESRGEETFLLLPPLIQSLTSCWETSASLLLLLPRCALLESHGTPRLSARGSADAAASRHATQCSCLDTPVCALFFCFSRMPGNNQHL